MIDIFELTRPQVYDCCVAYCNEHEGSVYPNMVTIGPNADMCEFCNDTMNEWAHPVESPPDHEHLEWGWGYYGFADAPAA